MTAKIWVRVAASLLLGVSCVACSDGGPAPAPAATTEKRNDRQIAEDVRSKLQKDSRLQGRTFEVTVDSGTVILSGKVGSKEQFGTAQVLAAGTAGVKAVINRLVIEP